MFRPAFNKVFSSVFASVFSNDAPDNTLPIIPSDGLLAEWRFDDGSGTTVTDYANGNDIDLTLPTNPNAVWTSRGVSANLGAIQTPVIANGRTTVFMYKAAKGETAFHMSGPVHPSGGIVGTGTTVGENYKMGQGFGVGVVPARADNGGGAYRIDSSEYRVMFREYAASASGYATFGSRSASTLNRFTTYEIAYALMYDRVLTAKEQEDIYTVLRGVAVDRSISMDFRDLPNTEDLILMSGQSNSDGRGLITGLSAGDQARTYTQTKILAEDISWSIEETAVLQLGVNHNDASATYFGVEIPIANIREDTTGARNLRICKTAQGGVPLAPSTDPNVTVTFSTDELPTSSGVYRGILEQLGYFIDDALAEGVGLEIKALIWHQGETDADFVSTADVYETGLTALFQLYDDWLGVSNYPIFLNRIRDATPLSPAGYATVRTAQASVVTALGARASIIDCDSYSFGDDVHMDATGVQDLGADLEALIW